MVRNFQNADVYECSNLNTINKINLRLCLYAFTLKYDFNTRKLINHHTAIFLSFKLI